MKKQSAGLLVYKIEDNQIKVLIAHMGGPWYAKKTQGSWSIPKGVYEGSEAPLDAAKREFKEELGLDAPEGEYLALGEIEQKNNKIVTAWTVEADLDVGETTSNTVEIEWPPRSGTKLEFPEIDKAEYFSLDNAAAKLIPEQVELLVRLATLLDKPWRQKSAEPEKPLQNSLF